MNAAASASCAVLQADRLSFGYDGHPVFDGFCASIPAGVTLVRGGDGRGKTTLLRLLAGELPAQSGALRANEVDLHADPQGYRRQIFWMAPDSRAFDQCTPIEYLRQASERWPGFDTSRVDALIAGLSLSEHLHKKLFMLSTGSRRKVWLAAAFAADAPVTLIDGPFVALDRPSILFVIERLRLAALQPERATLFTDWEAPDGVPLASMIDLGD